MNPIKIFSDTNCDLYEDVRTLHNIDLINFSIFINGEEIALDPDWKAIDYKTLYNTLRAGSKIYILSTTEREIKNKFRKYLKQGYDILYVGCCGKQSKTLFKVLRIAEQLREEFPDQRVEVIDSLNASIGQGFVVLKACELVEAGLPLDEVIEKTMAMRNNVIEYCTVETLTYLSRAERVKATTATFGNLFKVKPILFSDREGNQASIKKVKGRKESIDEVIRLFLENVTEPENQEIYIIHGDDLETAKYVKDKLLESGVKFKGINTIVVGAIIGISTGPGMIGLFGMGKEVTILGN